LHAPANLYHKLLAPRIFNRDFHFELPLEKLLLMRWPSTFRTWHTARRFSIENSGLYSGLLLPLSSSLSLKILAIICVEARETIFFSVAIHQFQQLFACSFARGLQRLKRIFRVRLFDFAAPL
jgi:hypothetical protein